MCYTCGCKLPYEDHGDPANLVEADLERAGATETIGRAGTVKAKENLLELIRLQQEAGEMAEPKAVLIPTPFTAHQRRFP